LYQRIADNEIQSGFILLENVKFWCTDDLVHDYADNELSGELIFPIEDIHRIELINQRPRNRFNPFPAVKNTDKQAPELVERDNM